MGAVKVVEKPNLYPGVTPLLRQTKGPVAYMGEVITNVHVFLNEAEVREATLAFGGLPKAEADVLQAEVDVLAEKVEEQHAELLELRELAAACEKFYRRKRSGLSAVTAA